MKTLKTTAILCLILGVMGVISAFTNCKSENSSPSAKQTKNKTMNMFVSHGHCTTPFTGKINNFNLDLIERNDLGNPLENMRLSFEIDPHSFIVCAEDNLTKKLKTPGLFIDEKDEPITFTTTNTYTVGIDWYEINGILSIKGIEKPVKFYASGIRNTNATWPTHLVIEGQIDLFDWGIDYDKIVNGHSDPVPNKWMHFNTKIDMLPYNTMGPKSQIIQN